MMMPLYRYMDSNPCQRNQTFSFPQYHYPGFGSNPSMIRDPWPYGGNYGYPMPCHSCCNHNFRPSYPHPSMPSPQHFYGGYPVPHHEAYSVPYVLPPPHYSMEIPKYEYDKMAPQNYHCCGCPNHVCHQNVDKGVKIEEQGSDVVDKKADLVPVHMNNHYPTLWSPPESMNGRERRKVSQPEVVEETKFPTDSKPPEGLKPQGDQRHSWFPFDLNDIGALMQEGNREPRQEQQVEDKKKEFPFPIFWMPPYQEAGKKDNNVNASRDHKTEDEKKQIPFPFFLFPYGNKEEEVRKEGNREENSAPKIVPMNINEGGVTKEACTNEEKPAGQGAEERKEKTANPKSIVVKQMDPHKEEKNSEDAERRGRSVPVKQVEENVGNKPSDTSIKRQSSSPKKSSELPPVCLRVDPLPRKKKANGSSRSPSPPAQKGNKKEVEPSKKEKATEVVDGTISENKDPMRTSKIPDNSKEDVSRNPTVQESERDGDRCQTNKDEGAQKVADAKSEETNKPMEATKSVADGKLKRRTLSDIEAAVLIQSAFRGFEVRRWEPLKKLKQIADIREQVADIRNRISTLEISDLQKDDKQRLIIGETIMRLLLKLDTIQGLLPSLRDIRRSLARELVVLQEKLDEFNAKKSQNPTQEVSTVEHMEELGENTNSGNCMLEQQREDVTGLGEGLPDGVSDSSHHGTDHCQGEVLQNVEPERGLRAEEPGHCNHRELHAAAEDGDQERQVESCLKSEDNGSAPIVETKDDVIGEQSHTGDMAVGDAEMENGSTQLGQCSEAPSLVEGNHTLTGNSSEAVNINVETREPGELPRGVTDDEPVILERGKDEQVEVLPDVAPPNACACVMEKDLDMQELAELSRGMIDEHNALTESTILEPEIVEQVELSPDVTSSNACACVSEKEAEMQELAELPRGMTDEHNALDESKEIEEVGVVKEDDVAFDVTSQPDGTSNTDQLEQRQEAAVEEQPIVRLEQRVEVGSQEDEGRSSDSLLDLEVELQPQEQVRKDDHLPLASESIETQALSLPVQTEAHDVVHEDGPLDIIHDHHSGGRRIEDEVPIERSTKDSENLRAETVKEDTKMQESNLECEDMKNALSNVPETVTKDVFSETQSTPVQKSESLPEKQVVIEASSIDGDVTEFESGRMLIEENEKLRAMMQKFMVAGNEQLQAISNLTSRVKDLEKKLARKKKVRGRRLPARARPSNNRSKEMDAGGAM